MASKPAGGRYRDPVTGRLLAIRRVQYDRDIYYQEQSQAAQQGRLLARVSELERRGA